jgi:RND family efflux transporter MFP subunit
MTQAAEVVDSGRAAMRVRAAKRRRRLAINLAMAVVAVAAGGIYLNSRRSQTGLPQGLYTGKAERMDLVETVSATGSVTAQTGAMVKIGSQITGRIKQLHADVGSHIGAGEVIAELDVPDLRAQVQQAEAAVRLATANLQQQLSGVALQRTQAATEIEKAQAALGVAQANLKQVQESANLQRATAQAAVRQAQANANNTAANLRRLTQVHDQGLLADSDLDAAKAQAEVSAAQLASAQENLQLVEAKIAADLPTAQQQVRQAQAALDAANAGTAQNAIKAQQVASARAALKQAQANLAVARAQLDKAYIRSPISGTVLQLTQQQGETIAAGLSAPTLIIVADLDRLQVDAFVDETDIGRVKLGQRAQVTVDAYPDHPFYGRVQKIASGSTMQQNVVTYDTTIALENPAHMLKPDMTATVNITVARRGHVLAVPVDAIKPGIKGSTVIVMTTGGDGKPAFRPVLVRTGISDGEHTEILEGLRQGDTVVLAGQVPGMTTDTMPRFPGPLGFGAGVGRGGAGGRGGGGGGRGGGGR